MPAQALARAAPGADRGVGHTVYGLYMLSPFLLGVPALIGVAIAYARRDEADTLSRDHFEHQIKTVWSSAAWLAAAAVWATAALVAGVSAAGTEAVDMGTAAAFGALSVGAAAAAPLWFLGSSVFGWTRLASQRRVGHSRRV